MQDWFYNQKSFILAKDLGDHAPIKWLLDVYDTFVRLLGPQITKNAHLDSFYVWAYSIPVVFKCIDQVDTVEYSKHFIPFASHTAYWGALITCSVMTPVPWSLLCTPLAILCEISMHDFIAPALSPKMYEKACL